MKRRLSAALAVAGVALAIGCTLNLRASDHDDGETDTKGRNVNLTDLFVFREDWHTNAAGDAGNLIFIMNSNPRSLPRQQYFFNENAMYQFHVKRVTTSNNTKAYSAGEDVTLNFSFTAPGTNNVQAVTLSAIVDGVMTTTTTTTSGSPINTTPIGSASDTINALTVNGKTLTVFAGLKEDPFFFDVEQFFKVRAGIAAQNGNSLPVGFRSPSTANDFAAGYNVNGIVVRVPIAFLQSAAAETSFDVWETISLPN